MGDGLELERPAADGSMKGAGGAHHHEGVALARGGALHLRDGDEGREALRSHSLVETPEGRHWALFMASAAIRIRSGVAGASRLTCLPGAMEWSASSMAE